MALIKIQGNNICHPEAPMNAWITKTNPTVTVSESKLFD